MDHKLQIILAAKDMTQKAFLTASAQVTRFTKNIFSMRTAMIGVAGAAGIGMFVRKSMDVADAIGKAADAIGIGTGTLQEFRHAATLSGVSTEALDKSLLQFSKRFGKAKVDTGAMITYLKKYDQTLLDNIKTAKSTDDALKMVFDRMGSMANAADKAALADAAFGTAGLKMTVMVKEGAAGLAKMRQEARDLGIVMDDKLIRQSEKANDEIEKLTRVIKVQFMSAAVGLAPEIAKVAEQTTEWWKANQELIKQDIAGYVDNIQNALFGIKSFYDQLPEGVVGAAGAGLVGRALFGQKAGAIIALITLTSSKINQFKRDHPEIFGGAGFRGAGVTGSWGEPEVITPPKLLPPGIDTGAADAEKTKKAFESMCSDLKFKSNDYYNYRKEQLEKQAEEYKKYTGDKVLSHKWLIEKLNELDKDRASKKELGPELKQYYGFWSAYGDALEDFYTTNLDITKEDVEKTREAFESMYSDLKFKSNDYYNYRKAQLEKQAEDYEKYTGDTALAHKWLCEQIKALDAERLDASQKNNVWLVDMSERTADAIEDNFSKFYRDTFRGELDSAADYFRAFCHSLTDSFSDMMGQMTKEMLFGGGSSGSSGLFKSILKIFSGGGYNYNAADWASTEFHSGGRVGKDSAPTRKVPASVFANAPRLHKGLDPDEFPAILQRGETVIPRGQSVSNVQNLTISVPVNIEGQADERLTSKLAYEIEETAKRVMREEMR